MLKLASSRFLALTLIVFVAVACNLAERFKNRNGGNSATSNVNSSPPGESYVFTSEEGRFTVTLPPGYPQPERRGEIYQSIIADRGGCIMLFRDLPPSSVRGMTSRQILERAQQQLPDRLRGDVETIEEINVQGHPGIRILASRGAMGGRFDLILAGSRLYEVAFAAPRKEERDTPEVRAYFDSFRITGDTPSATPPARRRP